jgi:hypothetical protein
LAAQFREQVQDHRKLSCGAGDLDAEVRGVFGQVEDPRAVGEERRAAFAEIQASRVDLHE